MSNYRLEISNSSDTFDSVHHSVTDFTIEWKKDDGFKADYNREIPDITFIKSEFEYFKNIQTNGNQCDSNTVKVYQKCGTGEDLKFTGSFNMSNGKWDYDKCTVSFKVREKSDYRCFEEDEDEVNLLDFLQTYSADVNYYTLYIDWYLCDRNDNDPTCDDTYIEDQYLTYIGDIAPFGIDGFAIYARFSMRVPCDVELTDDWILYDDCTDGVRTYVKPIDSSNGTDLPPFSIADRLDDGQGDLWVYAGWNSYPTYSQIDNGMKLHDALQWLLFISCGGEAGENPGEFTSNLTIVSDFFQWNPENESSINYVTGETNIWTNLLLFQKSDVKRPGATNNATVAKTYFLKLLENVCGIFNLKYKIIDDTLRIEHISYFQNSTGLNLVSLDSEKGMLIGSKKYEYDRNKLYQKETFQFMHDIGSLDFVGVDILYDCSDEFDIKKKENKVEDVFTDLMACLTNYSPDNSNVTDDGFVILACDTVYNDGHYNVLSVDGVLDSVATPNNVLGWAYLHDKLWRDGRYYKSGEMNNVDTDFTNINPYYKQNPFSIIIPCNTMNGFNPTDKLKGMLGWGFIESARYSLNKCSMELNLLLQEIQDVNALTETELGDFDGNFDNDFD